ncbi:MAG: hypothetical protein ACLQBA_00910 [Candidatus Binataceae bacterium]|jgi:hypothetical protein
MTPAELEILRFRVQLEALRVLVRGLYTGIANSSPTAPAILRERFAALRNEHGKIALKGTTPEQSDLIAAEYQEALDDLLQFIEGGLRK